MKQARPKLTKINSFKQMQTHCIAQHSAALQAWQS
jgi:hypothetical protein